MQASLNIPASKLCQFQELVKSHGLRFMGNPYVYGDTAVVCVDGDHLPQGECNRFIENWARLTTPINERFTPTWKRLARRMGLKL